VLKFKVLRPNIYAVEGTTSQEVARLFLRFQECYESPKFHHKIFTLEDFVPYYKKFTKSKEFTYYNDWVGFNVPSTIINSFVSGRFNPLSKEELWLVNKIKKANKANKGERYYVIGYKANSKSTIKHELAHAKFHINYDYKCKVLSAINSILPKKKISKIMRHLEKMGYHETTVLDELHAYTLCEKSLLSGERLWSKDMSKLQKVLEKTFRAYK
jgi:hypothetical protein